MERTGHFLGKTDFVPPLCDGGKGSPGTEFSVVQGWWSPWPWLVEIMATLNFFLWKALENILPTGISWCSSFSFAFSNISLNSQLLWSLSVADVSGVGCLGWEEPERNDGGSLTPLSSSLDVFPAVKQRAVTHSSTERVGGGSPPAVK